MNTPSNAMPDAPRESQVVAPAAISEGRRLYWSVRRELWESRSIYIAPLAVAALFLAGFLVSLVRLPAKMRAAVAASPMEQHELITDPYTFASLLIMGATFLVAIFYCIDALYGERRDRSVLFWKSLPVSDRTTVLSKASIPMVVLPLLTFVITVVTQWIMLLASTVVLVGSGGGVRMLWDHVSLLPMSLMLFYHLFVIHSLWYAPIFGWLLLVSGWARRMPFLWAVLPLFAIGFAERIAFNTSYFAGMLRDRMGGSGGGTVSARDMPMDAVLHLSPLEFLGSPGFWIGLGLTAAFLAAAIRLRRYREPI